MRVRFFIVKKGATNNGKRIKARINTMVLDWICNTIVNSVVFSKHRCLMCMYVYKYIVYMYVFCNCPLRGCKNSDTSVVTVSKPIAIAPWVGKVQDEPRTF